MKSLNMWIIYMHIHENLISDIWYFSYRAGLIVSWAHRLFICIMWPFTGHQTTTLIFIIMKDFKTMVAYLVEQCFSMLYCSIQALGNTNSHTGAWPRWLDLLRTSKCISWYEKWLPECRIEQNVKSINFYKIKAVRTARQSALRKNWTNFMAIKIHQSRNTYYTSRFTAAMPQQVTELTVSTTV